MHGTTTLERPDRQAIAFEVARATYELARAEYDRLWAMHEAAEDQWDRECPRVDRYFDEYRLGIGMSRDRVVVELRIHTHVTGKPLDVEAIADEFMAYQDNHNATKAQFQVEALSQAAFDYGQAHYFPARETLMLTPATRADDLLLKMEIAATWVDEPFVDSVFADVRHLLSVGA